MTAGEKAESDQEGHVQLIQSGRNGVGEVPEPDLLASLPELGLVPSCIEWAVGDQREAPTLSASLDSLLWSKDSMKSTSKARDFGSEYLTYSAIIAGMGQP